MKSVAKDSWKCHVNRSRQITSPEELLHLPEELLHLPEELLHLNGPPVS
ncbi:MAG: hypothetical protein HQ518_27845 [Rhodopirellula sp.]|nr:hypothetical protein [Rhodopirellula sp.]